MLLEKNIIIRVVFSFIFIALSIRVLGPILIHFLKSKLPGHASHETDIDVLIKNQKERFKGQYGISENPPRQKPSQEVHQIYKESQWGGGGFLKEIQQEFKKSFSFSIESTKVNEFILLSEKRNYLSYLDSKDLTSQTALKNFMMALLIFYLIIEELQKKKFSLLLKLANLLHVPTDELARAFQIKLLMAVNGKTPLSEDHIFSKDLVIHQYSLETINEAFLEILKKEANLWSKSFSRLFEELTLALSFSSYLSPIPQLKNKNDRETACGILGVTLDQNGEEIKKAYKKMALLRHPDKIISQKLPRILEQKAMNQFKQIQEAYEVALNHKK